ncbi:MAG: DNA polymerase III subunit gamma/tau, partial [Bryobacteraceae bacterium]
IARKYRPSQFDELISQEHVRTTLENAITQKRIAHGYILAGQRGTGKTTVARIIARCLNCIEGPTPVPCGVCASCLEVVSGSSVDVIEIDAASNRGINEMRELRDNIRYRPARDRYKVFIIDEAHQITSEAFNALLKTLEEPPEWVVFVLCTTEVHKIPITIASRCQQFSFRSVNFQELVERMRWICAQEGIQADDEVLGVIAQVGEGSVRDSLSALDQAIACCGSTLRCADIRDLLGLFSLESMQHITSALHDSNSQRMIEIVQNLESNGRSLHHFTRELARFFRNLLVARIAGKETSLIAAPASEQGKLLETSRNFSEQDLTRYLQLTLETYKELQTSLQPRLHLELGLLRLIHASRLTEIEAAIAGLGPSDQVPITPKTSDAEPRRGPPPFEADRKRKDSPVVANSPVWSTGDLRERLHQALVATGCAFTADALEHSEVSEQGTTLMFVTPKAFAISMNEGDLKRAALQALGKAYAIKLSVGTSATAPAVALTPGTLTPGKPAATDDELMGRVTADPIIQSYQDKFPGSELRQARDLKE